MAHTHASPTFKDSLTVRPRSLASKSVVKDSLTTAVKWPSRDLEQTIAGSLPLPSPLPMGEAEVRVRRMGEDRGEGAQPVAEILEA